MKKQRYKSSGKRGFFDEQFRKERLTAIGNPLEAISRVVDFEFFRPTLETHLTNTDKKNNAGAKPYDYVMMFKIMILNLNNLK